MALWRYIGPHEAVTVRVAGNDFGTVEQGGQLAIPDDLAQEVVFPEDLWERADKARREPRENRQIGTVTPPENNPPKDDA